MKLKLLSLLFLASVSSFAQDYTLIPDVKFENRLINLGIDSGMADGKVLTANVSSLTSLNLSSASITDLTGIQDFVALTSLICHSNSLKNLDVTKNTALTTLDCYSNQLTTLDVSQNTALTKLSCYSNRLTALDVSKNTALGYLDCSSNPLKALDVSQNTALNDLDCSLDQLTILDVSKNTALKNLNCSTNQLTTLDVSKNIALLGFTCSANQLTTLDVSQNTALKILNCYDNQLTALDVSKNTALVSLSCFYNQLTSLNLKNGNNVNLSFEDFRSNPNLTCIQVDDVAYSKAKWSSRKDAKASYNTNCPTLGIEDVVFDKIAVYPNPTKGEVHIDNCVVEKATVYDALGKLVKTITFAKGSNNSSINLAGAPSGIYYIYMESEGSTLVKKIILEQKVL